MKIREFDWSEVVEYLDNNLDKQFDYGNCWSNEVVKTRRCNCLMASFFDSKGVAFDHVSFCGKEALNENIVIAGIKNSPLTIIGEIHTNAAMDSLIFGRDIKKRLDQITNQN